MEILNVEPALLSRIAEALKGYDEYEDLYLVVTSEQPYDVVFGGSSEEVKEYSEDKYHVFGPFSYSKPERKSDRKSIVKSVSIAYEIHGKEVVVTHSPDDIDAIFLSKASVEKFVVPYYASLYGLDGAKEVLGKIDIDMAAVHDRKTRWLK